MPEVAPYNDNDLFVRIQGGDESAFSILYDTYAPALIDFAASRLSSLDEASDVVHDLFVHLWEERANINIQVSLRAFLFAATRYRIIDHLRRNSTRKKYTDKLAQLTNITLTTEDVIFAKDLERRLHDAINELSPRLRQVFKLSRFEHKTIKEIASEMDISEQTVKNQLSTALSQMRSKLAKIYFVLWWL